MKKSIIKTSNPVSRRETLALLASAGLFSLPGLNLFAGNTNSQSDTTVKKMKNTTNNNETTMKTIGILGGLGPQATMDLEMRIHKAAQQLIEPAQNSGYPPMIVHYYRHPPILLTKDNQPVVPFRADPRLLEVAKNLGVATNFLVIASNGMHMFQKEIEQASGRNVVSMIDATLEEVKKRGWKNVGVLGLMNSRIYTNRLKDLGIIYETIDDGLQEKLNQAIFRVMEGREDDTDRAVAKQAIDQLRNKKVDGIIPGCTEIPFLLGQNMNGADILNPVQLTAESAVKYALL